MVTRTEVYDTVRVETLEIGDRIEFCGYTCVVKVINDQGNWLYLDLYNEDEDEDIEAEPFASTVFVNLVHDVDED